MSGPSEAAFSAYVDLASERLGGRAILASDEFFAEKENLLKPGRSVFIPEKYTDRGKWMDGWETRRKRVAGYDWCVIRLGVPGTVRGLDIDTNFFLGNHPPFASLETCELDEATAARLEAASERGASEAAEAWKGVQWFEILPKSPLAAGSQNFFAVNGERRATHVRLNIYPDGGVARLRVYGELSPPAPKPGEAIDLASVTRGARAVACSDMFFSHMQNLIMPGASLNMGDGWETKRRRGPGHDWVIVRLSENAAIGKVEIFTTHFKGNYPDRFSLDAISAPGEDVDVLNAHSFEWTRVIPETKLAADSAFAFDKEILAHGPFSHVRLNIFPDGGIARLRVWAVGKDA